MTALLGPAVGLAIVAVTVLAVRAADVLRPPQGRPQVHEEDR